MTRTRSSGLLGGVLFALSIFLCGSALGLEHRVVKLDSPPDSVALSWEDPDPTLFCIWSGDDPDTLTLADSTTTLSWVDTPPAAALWFYRVDEAPSGDCTAPTPSEICERWNRDYPELSADVWDGPLSGCDHGTVDPVAIEDAVRRTNLYRWLLGLPPISENPEYSYNVQAAAVILRGLGALTHTPEPGDPCYTPEGETGAGSSNLCWNCRSLASAVDTYIGDFGVDSLGHRRWLFHPPYAEGGFGFVEDASFTWSGQWVFGWGPDPAPEFVAYPAPGPFPTQALHGHWSFAVDGADFSGAWVEVTRLSNGSPMTVTGTYVPAEGFGLNTLAWDVEGVVEDEEYEIHINGVSSTPMRSYTYVTHLVNCQ
jgi:hypothetical protein